VSLEAFSRVWQHSAAQHGTLLVCLAIANEVRAAIRMPGRPRFQVPVCWPGKHYLAELARLDKRTVDICVEELAALGELVIVPDKDLHRDVRRAIGNGGGSNLYLLTLGLSAADRQAVEDWLRGGETPPQGWRNASGVSAAEGGVCSTQGVGKRHPIQEEPGESRRTRAPEGDGTEPPPALPKLDGRSWAILARLAAGRKLLHVDRPAAGDPFCIVQGSTVECSPAEAEQLVELGIIEPCAVPDDPAWDGYRITAAGRAVVRARRRPPSPGELPFESTPTAATEDG